MVKRTLDGSITWEVGMEVIVSSPATTYHSEFTITLQVKTVGRVWVTLGSTDVDTIPYQLEGKRFSVDTGISESLYGYQGWQVFASQEHLQSAREARQREHEVRGWLQRVQPLPYAAPQEVVDKLHATLTEIGVI